MNKFITLISIREYIVRVIRRVVRCHRPRPKIEERVGKHVNTYESKFFLAMIDLVMS